MKISADIIAPSITQILNLSIHTGIFPQCWKESKVVPLHKSGPTDKAENYRPISILPVLSKILERHVHDCLYHYICNHNLLNNNQSGFRPKHSCFTLLTKITEKWVSAINNDEMVGSVMIDFRKAFDLIDHQLLLTKLKMYGLNESAVSWMHSYLECRSQRVFYGSQLSSPLNVKLGVPQGSILGPLLFILYINDLVLHIDDCEVEFYADDTTLYQSAKSLTELEQVLNLNLKNIDKWCSENKMLINTNKTKSILFGTSRKLKVCRQHGFNITVNELPIENMSTVKLLGLFIDESFTWHKHISHLCNTISKLLSVMRKYKPLLPQKTRLLFYNAYILPHLNYGVTMWGNASKSTLDRVFKLQKMAARLILDNCKELSTTEMFIQLQWLDIYEIVQFQKLLTVYKSLNNFYPDYMANLFSEKEQTNRQLRSSSTSQLNTPFPHIELFKKYLSYSGAIQWNTLSPQIQCATSVHNFTHLYRAQILSDRLTN